MENLDFYNALIQSSTKKNPEILKCIIEPISAFDL